MNVAKSVFPLKYRKFELDRCFFGGPIDLFWGGGVKCADIQFYSREVSLVFSPH